MSGDGIICHISFDIFHLPLKTFGFLSADELSETAGLKWKMKNVK